MYLATAELLGISIALISAMIVIGLSIKENIRLNDENAWLRNRNKQLKQQLDNSAPLPWKSDKKEWVN